MDLHCGLSEVKVQPGDMVRGERSLCSCPRAGTPPLPEKQEVVLTDDKSRGGAWTHMSNLGVVAMGDVISMETVGKVVMRVVLVDVAIRDVVGVVVRDVMGVAIRDVVGVVLVMCTVALEHVYLGEMVMMGLIVEEVMMGLIVEVVIALMGLLAAEAMLTCIVMTGLIGLVVVLGLTRSASVLGQA